jgi:hypothetical protein
MGPWLEADCETAMGAVRGSDGCERLITCGKQVIGPARLNAFASTGSPLGLQSVVDFAGRMNNTG